MSSKKIMEGRIESRLSLGGIQWYGEALSKTVTQEFADVIVSSTLEQVQKE